MVRVRVCNGLGFVMVRVCKGLGLGFVMTLQDIQESLIHRSRRMRVSNALLLSFFFVFLSSSLTL